VADRVGACPRVQGRVARNIARAGFLLIGDNVMRQIFLDTETTGLSADSGDRIVEVGCIEMVSRRLTGNTKHFYLNPERLNAPDAVKVHGLTDDFLADKPLFASIADELLAFLDGAEVIIHNAAFDVEFLDRELERIGRRPVRHTVGSITDSLAMAREMYPGKSNSLDALCRRLEVDNSARTTHGALLDAGLLADVYICMTRGQESLVIEHEASSQRAIETVAIDLSRLDLIVVQASDDERLAHEAWLGALDKSSGGKTVWRAPA
jgi:DNA polymerase III subunit epsilon